MEPPYRLHQQVASLWKVNDEATSILVTEFYKILNAKDKKMDRVDALRKSQETVRKYSQYSHPYYWGAFVLYGDCGNILAIK